jgi:hypothetical protein
LFKDKSYVDGKWVEAKSGKRFDVVGELSFTSDRRQRLTPFQIPAVERFGLQHQTTMQRMSMWQPEQHM